MKRRTFLQACAALVIGAGMDLSLRLGLPVEVLEPEPYVVSSWGWTGHLMEPDGTWTELPTTTTLVWSDGQRTTEVTQPKARDRTFTTSEIYRSNGRLFVWLEAPA